MEGLSLASGEGIEVCIAIDDGAAVSSLRISENIDISLPELAVPRGCLCPRATLTPTWMSA